MEGVGELGYGYLQNKPPLYRPSPPLTAIERFLLGNNNHFSLQPTPNIVKSNEPHIPSSGFHGFSLLRGAIGSFSGRFSWSCVPETRFTDRLRETVNRTQDTNLNVGLNEENISVPRNSKGVVKTVKDRSFTPQIKRKWTDEEDRCWFLLGRFSWSCVPETRFTDRLRETVNRTQDTNLNVGLNEENISVPRNSKGVVKTVKDRSFTPQIKGKWTDEEDRSVGELGYGYLQNKPPLYRPNPPLTAIERFLLGNNNHFSLQPTPNIVKSNEPHIPSSGFHGFSLLRGAIGSFSGRFSWSCVPETRFTDRLRETVNRTQDTNLNVGLNEENISVPRNSKGVVKTVKDRSFTPQIKGKWTDEEDRRFLLGRFSWSCVPETRFTDRLRETVNRTQDTNLNVGLNEENISVPRNSKGVVKTVKDRSFTPQIKGKWTDEEDRSVGELWYGYLQNKPPLYRPSPPLTAIERFLLGNNNHFSLQPTPNIVKSNEPHIPSSGFHGFSPLHGAIGSFSGRFSWSCVPETRFTDRLRETVNRTQDTNLNVGLNEENISVPRNSKGVVKTVKDRSFTPQIKGKWTDEEDRKLLKLVRQHGVRKWAQIAEKMLGRAGKQCRERWHSHLRPDIKKDCWSEEEEIKLVKVHKEIGNKWAEIGKQIPGRTENSIKNHWNATKRKLNSKGKIKKSEAQIRRDLTRSTILKNYIKSLNLSDAGTDIAPPITGSTTTPTGSTVTEEDFSNQSSLSLPPDLSEESIDNSPHFMYQSYDDELNFMTNFFGNKDDQLPPPPPSIDNNNKDKGVIESSTVQNDHANNVLGHSGLSGVNSFGFNNNNGDHQFLNDKNNGDHQFVNDMIVGGDGFSSSITEPNMFINTHIEEPRKTHLSSDFYLPNLFDGATTTSPSMGWYYHGNNMVDSLTGQASSSGNGKKDTDLKEMFAASHFSHGGNGNPNFVL
ncbi:unnamed protein product [Camellia sinensis]